MDLGLAGIQGDVLDRKSLRDTTNGIPQSAAQRALQGHLDKLGRSPVVLQHFHRIRECPLRPLASLLVH